MDGCGDSHHAARLCSPPSRRIIAGGSTLDALMVGGVGHPIHGENRMIQLVSLLATVSMLAAPAAPDDKASLQGVWIAQSVENEGKPSSAENVRLMRMRFAFRDDKLLFAVNLDGVFEDSAAIGSTPRNLQSIWISRQRNRTKERTVLGIYVIEGDELKVCLRNGRSHGGRPTEFSTKADSGLILVVFKRAKTK